MPRPPTELDHCPLAEALAAGLRECREDLTRRWLERIAARVSVDIERIFPTDELLDHVPLLIDGIADYMEDPAQEIVADMPVVGKAMELGELRLAQGFDAFQILREYEILGGVLFSFLGTLVEKETHACSQKELLVCGHRLFRAVSVIQQVTVTHYLRTMSEQVQEREERLRRFNRMVSHEFKNRMGAILGASQLLQEPTIAAAQAPQLTGIIVENVHNMQDLLENMIMLSRMDPESRRQKNVRLREAAWEVSRQLRHLASSRGVEIRIAEEMPDVEVDAAAVELCLANYISNGIKYMDPGAERRWVEVRAEVEQADEGQSELVVRVADNGIGVPEEARPRLYERFYRAHDETVTREEGTGLGLSLVRETVEGLGGRAWAEFPERGSIFAFSIPCPAPALAGAAEV